jgi:vitamin B12 transporter
MRISSRLFMSFSAVVFLLLNLSFARRVSAQGGATLDVNVFDPSEAAVAGASVELRSVSSPGETLQGIASGDGRYRFEAPPGNYRLTVTRESLQGSSREVTLKPGERRELRVTLALEPMSQSVLVSADAVAIAADAASEPSTVVSREDMDRRQATQLGPLLSTLPGISVAQADSAGGTTSLFIDGGNSNFTKVLVDGVTLNEPGGAIDLSNFTLDDVDKIEVVRGAQSALSGSDAMTGVVEVLTHRGSTRVPQLLLEGDGGTFSSGHGLARLSGLAGRLDYSAAAAYFSTAGREPNDRFLNRTLSGNFGIRVDDDNSLRLTLRNNTSDAGAPGQTLFTPPNLDQHNALQNFTAGLTWDGSAGPHWQYRLAGHETYIRQLFDNELSDFYTSPDPFGSCTGLPRSAGAMPSAYCDFPYHASSQLNRAGFETEASYAAGPASLTVGYVYEVENAFLSALNGRHARRNNQAGFLAGRWSIVGGRLVLNAGFRVEDNDSFGTKVVPRSGVEFTARRGGDALGATRLRFSYGAGIKEPRLDQSFGTDLCDPGNPNLRPEKSRTVSAGVEQQLAHDRVRVSADFFENRFRDIVSFDFCFPGGPCPVTPPGGCPFGFGTYFNTDLARARGTDISAEARVNRYLLVNVNYTLDETRVLESPNAVDPALVPDNRLFRRPVHSGNIAVSGGFRRVGGSFTARFAGRRTDSDFLFPALGLTSNPGYAVFNVAGSFRVNSKVTATARVDNLFNEAYQQILGYPALGRAAQVGMRFTFGGE